MVVAVNGTLEAGWNGVTAPIDTVIASQVQPACSTMTARLNAALVAVGIVVGLVVVSEGAQ